MSVDDFTAEQDENMHGLHVRHSPCRSGRSSSSHTLNSTTAGLAGLGRDQALTNAPETPRQTGVTYLKNMFHYPVGTSPRV